MSLCDFADYAEVSYRSVKRWKAAGMPAYPTIRGKTVEVESDEALTWMRQHGKVAADAFPAAAPAPIENTGLMSAPAPIENTGLTSEPATGLTENTGLTTPIENTGFTSEPTNLEARDAVWDAIRRGLVEISERERLDLSPYNIKTLLDVALVLEQQAGRARQDDELRQRPLTQLAKDVGENFRRQFKIA